MKKVKLRGKVSPVGGIKPPTVINYQTIRLRRRLSLRSKLKWEHYKRKEESYKKLLRSLGGFYENVQNDTKMKTEFLTQVRLCWMYASDEVIKKAYIFLNTVNDSSETTQKEKQQALSSFIEEIRKDILLSKKTKLTAKDFKHLKSK